MMEKARLFVSVLCLAPWLILKNLIKQLRLIASVFIFSAALGLVVKLLIKVGFSSFPFLVALIIGLLLILGLLVLSISFLSYELQHNLKHDLVTQLGSRTIGRIIRANEGVADYSDGDPCIDGAYAFRDSHGREHRFDFSRAIHYPNRQQWDEFKREYSVGTKFTVYYLPWSPSIHEIDL
jgi:energy-coupling factor transporter transmembrane protein EcfT